MNYYLKNRQETNCVLCNSIVLYFSLHSLSVIVIYYYYALLHHLLLDCERNVDCVFLLDRSGSVGRTNHNIALNFISNVISFFTIGSNSSRIGMAAYSSSSAIQFDLDDHTTSQALINGVSQVGFNGGSTNTPSALDHARLLLNPANNRGARPNSFGIPKIAILITGW